MEEVNQAGAKHVANGYSCNTPFWKQPIMIFDDFYAVGLRSSYLCRQYASEIMTAQKSGLIVNISLYAARQYLINPVHGIIKAATDKMTADTAHELKEFGGNVRTEGMMELPRQNSAMNVNEMESPQFVGMCVAALAF